MRWLVTLSLLAFVPSAATADPIGAILQQAAQVAVEWGLPFIRDYAIGKVLDTFIEEEKATAKDFKTHLARCEAQFRSIDARTADQFRALSARIGEQMPRDEALRLFRDVRQEFKAELDKERATREAALAAERRTRQEAIDVINGELARHETQLRQHRYTLEQHGQLLEQHSQRLDQHGRRLDRLEDIFKGYLPYTPPSPLFADLSISHKPTSHPLLVAWAEVLADMERNRWALAVHAARHQPAGATYDELKLQERLLKQRGELVFLTTLATASDLHVERAKLLKVHSPRSPEVVACDARLSCVSWLIPNTTPVKDGEHQGRWIPTRQLFGDDLSLVLQGLREAGASPRLLVPVLHNAFMTFRSPECTLLLTDPRAHGLFAEQAEVLLAWRKLAARVPILEAQFLAAERKFGLGHPETARIVDRKQALIREALGMAPRLFTTYGRALEQYVDAMAQRQWSREDATFFRRTILTNLGSACAVFTAFTEPGSDRLVAQPFSDAELAILWKTLHAAVVFTAKDLPDFPPLAADERFVGDLQWVEGQRLIALGPRGLKVLDEKGTVVATSAGLLNDASVKRIKIRGDWILAFTSQHVVFLQYEAADRFVFRARMPLTGSVDVDLLFLAGIPTAVDASPKGVIQLIFLEKPIRDSNLVRLQSEPFFYSGGIEQVVSHSRQRAFDSVYVRQPDGTIGAYECTTSLVRSATEKTPHTLKARWQRLDKWQSKPGPGMLFHDERLNRPFVLSENRCEYPGSAAQAAIECTLAGGAAQVHPGGHVIAHWPEDGGRAEVVEAAGAELHPLVVIDLHYFPVKHVFPAHGGRVLLLQGITGTVKRLNLSERPQD